MAERALLVGLGNPGLRYANNRHNIGFQVMDRLAGRHGLRFDRWQNETLISTGRMADRPVILAKPQTYMNDSGRSVNALLRFYKIDPSALVVVYDDLDLPFGTVRIRPEGSAGGHKGMTSIIQRLGRQDFPRIRLGIGRPPGRMDPADYVLHDFSPAEQPVLLQVYDRAVAALEAILRDGVISAMNTYNGSVDNNREPTQSIRSTPAGL
jgi:PTH1 family peptidyl-tRNA hydrolase